MLLPPEFAASTSPPDWAAVFGFDGPLELEIGSGHGGFAARYAAAHPEARLVAVEKREKFALQTAARAQRTGATNVRVIWAEAELVVPRLFAGASLAVVHVHFPDPWWKRRHLRRRLLTDRFAEVLFEKLGPGGAVDVRTDVADRAIEMLRVFESAGLVNQAGEFGFAERAPDDVPSSREVRYLETGQRVYRLRLLKR